MGTLLSRGDHLASVRVGASPRIHVVGSFCESGHFRARRPKSLDLLVDLVKVPVNEFPGVRASRLPSILHVQDASDLGERQARPLGVTNEAQAFASVVPIVSVVGRRSLRGSKQTDALVVPNGLGADASLVS
jgi:hypothetical protein